MKYLDSHQHFWSYNPVEHTWMDERMTVLKRDYLPSDLQPLLVAEQYQGSIVVQARQSMEETQWLLNLAGQHGFIKGVVGWVDLCSPELPAQLEALSRQPKLVGVRHVLHDEPDERFMLRDEFRRGIARLQEFNLTYDLLVFPKHLPLATQLVREFPGQKFVLDHLGKPRIGEKLLSPWDVDLAVLAGCPNVYCKLSGMVTEAAWGQWQPADFQPYLDVVFKVFGPERLMIGSDWPVCNLSGDYASTMGMVSRYLEKFPLSVRELILGLNCARFYGLKA